MCPSGWQLAQEKVSVVDARALLNAILPSLKVGCVGSSRVIILVTFGFSGELISTSDTELSTAFKTQAFIGFF